MAGDPAFEGRLQKQQITSGGGLGVCDGLAADLEAVEGLTDAGGGVVLARGGKRCGLRPGSSMRWPLNSST